MIEHYLERIRAELTRARAKFPGKNVTMLALMEEVGELATALFEEPRENVHTEAIQVAVMALRVILDGDNTIDDWRAEKGLDPLISPNYIVYTDDNLLEVLDAVGRHPKFSEWFKSDQEYVDYVKQHNGLFKVFYGSGHQAHYYPGDIVPLTLKPHANT